MDNNELKKHALNVRRNIIEMVYAAQSGHPGGSLGCADILTYLYFEGMNATWNKKFSSETMKHENLLVSTAMVRKDAYYDAGGFKLEGNGYYEDWIFWLKLMAMWKNMYQDKKL